jgi:hypothetical protein
MGTVRKCLTAAGDYLISLRPSHWRNRVNAREEDSLFDAKWGVDTCGITVPRPSEVVGSSWLHGFDYQAIGATTLYNALSGLTIEYEHFTFVDFGSGKGRALLTASRFPFNRIIGVEYDGHLNEAARRNVLHFPKSEKKCSSIDIICADAATFRIPPGPLVVFLYNPFGRPVMESVVNNVLVSYQQSPRRVIVIYFNPVLADTWKNAGFLLQEKASGCAIFDSEDRRSEGGTLSLVE